MRRDIPLSDILVELERDNMLPALVFRTSRSQCDSDAMRIASNERLHLPAERQRVLRTYVHEVAEKYDMDLELIRTNPQYQGLLLTGVGAHHAGQLLTWRLLLEELMAEGLLRVMVATGTVAAGVDFPARTVVITAHSRRGSEGFTTLSAAEFQQMSGRAGRRGRDTVGFCVVAPNPFCDARQLLKVAKRKPEPLSSAYFPSPSTVLNLLRYRNVDDLRYTVERSLAAFIDRRRGVELSQEAQEIEDELEDSALNEREAKRLRKRARRLKRQAEQAGSQQLALLDAALDGLRELGYLEGDTLSEKGYWAANLCTSLVLELAETIEDGVFDARSAEDLAALVASVAGDSYRTYLKTKKSVIEEKDVERISAVLRRVGESGMPGVVEDRQVLQSAAFTVITWMQAENWQEFRGLLLLSGVAEGDAARLITQTADHLNQLTRLMDTHRDLAFRAEEAKRRILRPPLTEAMNVEAIEGS